jgi:signal transduction histidine kinase
MRRWGLILGISGFALGVAAEWVAFGWREPLRWLPDLAVGWTFLGCGLLARVRRPDNNTGVLMMTTGFSWFLANFAGVDHRVLAWVAAHGIFVYRGPLVHLVLAYPLGRLSGRFTWVAAGAGYGAALVPQVSQSEAATIVLAGLVLSASAHRYLRAVGMVRRARLLSLYATAALSFVLMGVAVVNLVIGAPANLPMLVAFQVALLAIAAGLLGGLLSGSWERADVADLVVQLGEARSGTLRGELSRALGDPSLEVGYWVAEADAFVTAEGQVLSLPGVAGERRVSIVRRGDDPVAAIVHDATVLDDPGLSDAVAFAAELGASNARLQAELRGRVAELAGSRRRIVEARDEERQRLERRLREGAERRLDGLVDILRRGSVSALSETTRQRILRAQEQLDRTLDDIHGLALGLHPRILTERGLNDALALVSRSVPIPVRLDLTSGQVPEHVEKAAYFVCSEALANVAKHASASLVRVTVSRDGARVIVVVEDDGLGGADFARGSGLQGLADRLQASADRSRWRAFPDVERALQRRFL